MSLSFIDYWDRIVSFIMILSIFSILFFITYAVGIFFNKLMRKKSFEQIYNELHFQKTPKGEVTVLGDINFYLQEYVFEELLFFNLKCFGIQYFPYCHYFLLALFFLFFCIINFSGFLPIGLTPAIFLATSVITLFPIFIFGMFNRKAESGKPSWKRLGGRIYYNLLETVVITFTSLSIFLVVLYAINYLFYQKILNFELNDYFNYLVIFYNYLYSFEFVLVNSQQLSLAGFYFSLAIGGTVVLSIIDRYFKEANLLNTKLSEQVNIFNELYSKYNSCLNLKLSDIISFNHKKINYRRFHIKEIISFNKENISKFSNILSLLNTKLESIEIKNKYIILRKYRSFIILVFVTYILGIITILVPETFATYLFWIFILDSVFFAVFIYDIYITFRT